MCFNESVVLNVIYDQQAIVLLTLRLRWGVLSYSDEFLINQRIIAGNAQFAGIAAGRGVRFTTGLLLLGKGLGMRETPIRPHSWH